MWLTPGRASGRKKMLLQNFMMAQLEHGHCTARSTVLAAPPAMVKDKSGEGGQTAVGLDPINEGVQPDVTGCENCYMECEQYGKSIW